MGQQTRITLVAQEEGTTTELQRQHGFSPGTHGRNTKKALEFSLLSLGRFVDE